MRRIEWLAPMVLVALMAAAVPAVHAQGGPPPPPPPLNPLPPVPVPAGNPITAEKANLGKVLFWDEQLSATRTVACGSCHQPKSGGYDPRTVAGAPGTVNPGLDAAFGTADDIHGSPGVVLNTAGALQSSALYGMHTQVTGRSSMSFINSAYVPQAFWDGRAGTTFIDPETNATVLPTGGALENQVLGPPLSSVEMGSAGRVWADIEARLGTVTPLAIARGLPAPLSQYIGGRSYAALFAEAFGSPGITASRIAMAIATYERTLVSDQTPFDSLIAGTTTLTPQEQQGFALFGQVGCAGCHGGSMTTDNVFHYTGVRPAAEDSGRMIVTHNLGDLGAMKTPSLRNVALRGSYMHDGRFTTLAQVVAFYNRGGDFTAPNLAPGIRPLNLTQQQQQALVAFMSRPMTDPRVAQESGPFARPLLYSESAYVPEVLAGGVAGSAGIPQPVALEPPLAGNGDFTVGVFGAAAGAHAVLVIDEAEPPASGGVPATGSLARVDVTLAADGTGTAEAPIADDASLLGRTFYGRWYVDDASAADGVASSPAFRFVVFGANGEGLPLPVPAPAAPRTLRLYAGSPNPFPASTMLRFDLFTTSAVKLNVYDVTGRAVRRLYDRSSAMPGTYAIQWDGRDDSGRDLPGGMYFYRLDTDHGSETARVVRLQ